MKKNIFCILFMLTIVFVNAQQLSQDSIFNEGLKYCYSEMKFYNASATCSRRYKNKELKSDIKAIKYFLKASAVEKTKIKSLSKFFHDPSVFQYQFGDTIIHFIDRPFLNIFQYQLLYKVYQGKIIQRGVSISPIYSVDIPSDSVGRKDDLVYKRSVELSGSIVNCFYPEVIQKLRISNDYKLRLNGCDWLAIGDFFELISEVREYNKKK